jgi:hypothetical protein
MSTILLMACRHAGMIIVVLLLTSHSRINGVFLVENIVWRIVGTVRRPISDTESHFTSSRGGGRARL